MKLKPIYSNIWPKYSKHNIVANAAVLNNILTKATYLG